MARRTRLDEAVGWLRVELPDGWTTSVTHRASSGGGIRIGSPSGSAVELEVRTIKDAAPRSVSALASAEGPTLVVADWLSDRAQQILRAQGSSFLDLTGNAEVRLSEPGLFVRTEGAKRNPSPSLTKGPSLRGPKAWALLRTLAEVPPPLGVRELAEAVDVDAGYVSRVIRVLEDELAVTRTPRGPVTGVEWEGVLRRAASSYSLFDANVSTTWVASSGPERLLDDLTGKRAGPWAVTGSFAAARVAPVAAPEQAVIFTDDPERLAGAGRLLPATRGANVVLLEPYDPIVFDRTMTSDGIPYVSVAQAALDCLTGNARMPAEGEALLTWMRGNEARWRTGTLAARQKRRM
jgi:hypothetical protein